MLVAPATAAATTAVAAPASATAAAAAATAVAAPAAAATAAAFGLGTGFVHGQRPAFDLAAVERSNSGLRLGIAAHFDKTKRLGPARVAVHDYLCRLHRDMRLAKSLQITVGQAVGQVAYVQLLVHGGPPEKKHGCAPTPGWL